MFGLFGLLIVFSAAMFYICRAKIKNNVFMTLINFKKGINSAQLDVLLNLFDTWDVEVDVLESSSDKIGFLPSTEEEKLHSIQLAEDDMLAGKLISFEEMKSRHPRL